VVGIGLLVLFTYISSVMRFILFDSIVARECHIRQGWARRKRPGLRLFWWHIWLMLATFAALLIVIGIPVACAWALGWFAQARDHMLGLVLGGIVLFLVFLLLMVFLGVVYVMTKDFVVPQMALEDISAMEGWRRLWLWLKADKGGYAGYVGMKIVLAVGAAIALAIVTLIALVVLLIPIGGAGVVAVLAGKAAGLTWNFYTITLAVVRLHRARHSDLCLFVDLSAGYRVFSGVFHLFLRTKISAARIAALATTIGADPT
jgi:hypothetical protein